MVAVLEILEIGTVKIFEINSFSQNFLVRKVYKTQKIFTSVTSWIFLTRLQNLEYLKESDHFWDLLEKLASYNVCNHPS